jgi:hypothetical protein
MRTFSFASVGSRPSLPVRGVASAVVIAGIVLGALALAVLPGSSRDPRAVRIPADHKQRGVN